MKRKFEFIEGEYYHLYNRGNSKQLIFLDDADRDRFIKLLYLCNSYRNLNFREDIIKQKIDAWDFERGVQLVSIGAWVIMPNHFHILVTALPSPKSDLGQNNSISIFVQKVMTAYSKYFNKKYVRTGGLFETSFKSEIADTDEYMKYLFSYIHLNPVKLIDSNWKENGIRHIDKTTKFLNDYKWSSYQDYCGTKRSEGKIVSKADFPGYFEGEKDMTEEMFDWLLFSPKSDLG